MLQVGMLTIYILLNLGGRQISTGENSPVKEQISVYVHVFDVVSVVFMYLGQRMLTFIAFIYIYI